jgi:hypothetical protein
MMPAIGIPKRAILQLEVKELPEGRPESVGRTAAVLGDEIVKYVVGVSSAAVHGLAQVLHVSGDRVAPEEDAHLPDAVVLLALEPAHRCRPYRGRTRLLGQKWG